MPFTSEAVVACWSSLRNSVFLSPCRGLDPWQCQDHPRSCGVSNKTAPGGVFSNAETGPSESTRPSSHIHSQRALLCAVIPVDRPIPQEPGQLRHHLQHTGSSVDTCWKHQHKEGLAEVSLGLPEPYGTQRVLPCSTAAQLTDPG